MTSIATVVLGYMHFSEGGFTGSSATAHRFLGTSIAVVATLVFILRLKSEAFYRRAQIPIAVLLLVLVTLTGHYGGNLTHGDTFLVEYAPGPIRRLAGLEDARAPVTDIALADPYLDVVRPIFSQRCFSCHNNDKQRGKLNLASYESALKGGEDGPVLVAGKPDESDLYRRITLAGDHDDFMPAEGKTPLTEDQVAIIRWWIEAELPTGTTLASLKIPDDVQPKIVAQLGLGAAGAATVAAAATETKLADPALLEQLEKAGFLARQVSQSDAHLIINPAGAGAVLSAEQVTSLATAADQVVSLSLQSTGLEDAAMATVGKLSHLTFLRLDNNRLTDAGLAPLKGLPSLEYLNLYGNAGITDASIDTLGALASLKKVYLWGTKVSPRGAARLKTLRPDLLVDLGDGDGARTAGT